MKSTLINCFFACALGASNLCAQEVKSGDGITTPDQDMCVEAALKNVVKGKFPSVEVHHSTIVSEVEGVYAFFDETELKTLSADAETALGNVTLKAVFHAEAPIYISAEIDRNTGDYARTLYAPHTPSSLWDMPSSSDEVYLGVTQELVKVLREKVEECASFDNM